MAQAAAAACKINCECLVRMDGNCAVTAVIAFSAVLRGAIAIGSHGGPKYNISLYVFSAHLVLFTMICSPVIVMA